MDDILLITNADMSQQSGDVVLVNRRAREIFNLYNIKTVCFTVKGGINGTDYEYLKYLGSNSKKEIKEYVNKKKPCVIIFYGNRALMYVSFLRKITIDSKIECKLILDLQGALEEGIEHSQGINYIKNLARFYVRKYLLKKAVRIANGAFVVSDEMRKYCEKLLPQSIRNDFQTYKIRCGVNEVISTNQKLEWRNEIRREWNIDNDTVVMVFSGYRKKWQKIDETIELFKEYDSKHDNVFFAFFCNVDQSFIDRLKIEFPKGNYTLKFLSFDEYYKYLCACDVGFLIRDYNITNKVAFPNKFSDYLNAGLMVATNKALPESYSILLKEKIDFIDTDSTNLDLIYRKIHNRQNEIISFYKKTEMLCNKELKYSSQIEKEMNHVF